MKRITIITLALVLFTGITLSAQPAWGNNRNYDGKPRFGQQRMMEKLNLTDEQKDQFADIRLQNEKKDIELQSQIKLTRLEKREEMLKDSPDKSTILSLTEKITNLQGERKTNKIEMMFAMRELLTPEQIEIWKTSCRANGDFFGPCMNDGRFNKMRNPRHGRPGFGWNIDDDDDQFPGNPSK